MKRKIEIDRTFDWRQKEDGNYLITVYANKIVGTKYHGVISNSNLMAQFFDHERNPGRSHEASMQIITFVLRENGVLDFVIK